MVLPRDTQHQGIATARGILDDVELQEYPYVYQRGVRAQIDDIEGRFLELDFEPAGKKLKKAAAVALPRLRATRRDTRHRLHLGLTLALFGRLSARSVFS